MSHFGLYCLLMLDGIKGALQTISIICGAFLFAGGFAYFIMSDEISFSTPLLKTLKQACLIVFICIAMTTFLPTTKQAAVIWLVPAIANNQTVQETTDEVATVLRGLVKDWAEEFKPKKSTDGGGKI